MTGYQIMIKGRYICLSNEFKAFSKKIYLHKPTQNEIDDFIKICANSDSGFFDLDIEQPYECKITEMEIVE